VSLSGELLGFVDACFESEDTLDEMYDPVETPLDRSRDVFMHEKSPSLGCANVFPNPLDRSHFLPLCSLPSPSLEYYLDVLIHNSMICDASGDLGCEENIFCMLRKMLIILCPYSTLEGMMRLLIYIAYTYLIGLEK